MTRITVILIAFTLLAASSGTAQLSLLVDISTQKLAFSGSTTGTPTQDGNGWATWGNSTGESLETLEFLSVGTLLTSGSGGGGSIVFADLEASGEFLFLSISLAPEVETTIEGLDSFTSYSGFSAGNISALESMIGSSLILDLGTDFENVDVMAIPEPSTYALIFGATALGIAGYRRLREQKATA